MKLQLTNSEARQIVAEKYSVSAYEVEIAASSLPPPPPPPVSALFNSVGTAEIRTALTNLFDEGHVYGRGQRPNKIAMVAAIRTLTNCDLKSGKEFVDQLLLPF